jgi:hypothetical protein
MDFSAVAARLVCPEVPLADALIQLALRAPRLVRRKLDSRVAAHLSMVLLYVPYALAGSQRSSPRGGRLLTARSPLLRQGELKDRPLR